MLTPEDRQKLRSAAQAAINATPPRTSVQRVLDRWELQTSNSFRRIGCHGDGDVLCAVTQRSDGHPDLLAPPGVLDYVVAAQPRVVLALLDQLDAVDQQGRQIADVAVKLDRMQAIVSKVSSVLGALERVASGTAGEEDVCSVHGVIAEISWELSR